MGVGGPKEGKVGEELPAGEEVEDGGERDAVVGEGGVEGR
jgi:hypothetical protein